MSTGSVDASVLPLERKNKRLPGFVNRDRRARAIAVIEQLHPARDVPERFILIARREKTDPGREDFARPPGQRPYHDHQRSGCRYQRCKR